MLARRSAPSSMAIYPSKNTPCSNTSLRSCRCRFYYIIVESVLNRQADYISSSTRLATNAPMRRKAPLGTLAGQPGPLLVIRWLQIEKKNHTFWYGSFFLTGSYLSSQAASSQVLSTYKGLTTVFGMGTGGSP